MKIKILNKETNETWEEEFTSPYFMQKRINKLKHSKKLQVIRVDGGIEYEMYCMWKRNGKNKKSILL